MNIDFPPATVTLGHSELNEAVRDYLAKTRKLQTDGRLTQCRLGNLVQTDLQPCQAMGSPRPRVIGTFTFELLED